ncbi:MAG: valine--tRNA ligase [Bacteroidota bacterium]
MNIPSKYDPSLTEDKWYKYWLDNKFFESEPDDREPYCIVIPPPNVTGVLHMGHMLNNTIQDVLVRRARMMGKNALWVPGTDHASIATEAKVVSMLKEKGINKEDISREEFLKYAWEWKEKHGGIILEQLKKLGASCDWRRTKFTMDEDLSESVIDVFIDLNNKGYIYRGVRMVNWDPQAKTAVSDEEVIYVEEQSKLFYVKYKIVGEDKYLIIATTRPETILGDTAVCVNPNDKRYKHLKGKKVIVPMVNRTVSVIMDDYVDMEFGTGCLKITPAHDINDYEIGQRHNLPSIDIFNDDGTLNENAKLFIGEDREVARKSAYKKLVEIGAIEKVEDYINKVGRSERTNAVIEPKLSMQWFLGMKELVKPALENILNDNIKLYPAKYKNTYKHWMENVKDWCISRQLWWGHRIPVFYLPNGIYIPAKNINEAFEKAKEKNKNIKISDIRQDEDVLDTWFSSWLWPISVFDGIRFPENKDIKYYYPTNDLITAPEILFFWVARMIISGYEYMGDKPFKNVYLTGIVRDKLRRKMSKSLGNSPDPIALMKKYSADGVRMGMLLCSPAGNDILFDESLTEQGRNFGNKIWNAFRLVKTWNVDETISQPKHSELAIEWFTDKLNQSIEQIDDHFEKYRISDALMTVYKLFWDEFSGWYLEIIKPDYEKPIDKITMDYTIVFFDKLLKLLHPFMPFITEEIWHYMKERKDGESIMICSMPEKEKYNTDFLDKFETVKEIISAVRNIKKEKNIPLKESVELQFKVKNDYVDVFRQIILKSACLSDILFVKEKPENSVSFIIKTDEFYIPLVESINVDDEISKLNNELNYLNGFLESVMRKLSNDNFVKNAPAKVIEAEERKRDDAKMKINGIEEQLKTLNKPNL